MVEEAADEEKHVKSSAQVDVLCRFEIKTMKLRKCPKINKLPKTKKSKQSSMHFFCSDLECYSFSLLIVCIT